MAQPPSVRADRDGADGAIPTLITTINSMVLLEMVTHREERKQRKAGLRDLVQVLWRGLEPRSLPKKPAPAARKR